MNLCDDDHVREALLPGFAGRPTVGIRQAAKLLNMDEKSLRSIVRRGGIGFRIVGGGPLRTRREFTLADLTGFYADAASRGTGGARKARPSPGRRVHPASCGGGFLAGLITEKKR